VNILVIIESKLEKVEWYYQCQCCGAIIKTSMHEKVPIPPTECYESEGGCGRKSKFIDKTNEILHYKLEQSKKK
jgi:hypothetical protein